MTFLEPNSCQKEENYAMKQIGNVLYDTLIDTEHLYYEHIIFDLIAHSEMIKERLGRCDGSGTKVMDKCKIVKCDPIPDYIRRSVSIATWDHRNY
jgi:hypothetical protein